MSQNTKKGNIETSEANPQILFALICKITNTEWFLFFRETGEYISGIEESRWTSIDRRVSFSQADSCADGHGSRSQHKQQQGTTQTDAQHKKCTLS